jgi:hypothetical protein
MELSHNHYRRLAFCASAQRTAKRRVITQLIFNRGLRWSRIFNRCHAFFNKCDIYADEIVIIYNYRLRTVNTRSHPRRTEMRDAHLCHAPSSFCSSRAFLSTTRLCCSSSYLWELEIPSHRHIDSDFWRANLAFHRPFHRICLVPHLWIYVWWPKLDTMLMFHRADPQIPADSRRILELAFYQYQPRNVVAALCGRACSFLTFVLATAI